MCLSIMQLQFAPLCLYIFFCFVILRRNVVETEWSNADSSVHATEHLSSRVVGAAGMK